MSGWILHIDLDQFLVAVERLRRPELMGKPVIVGGAGDPTRRGVVASASYEARKFGVHSAMPLRIAARKCPQAVFVGVDFPAYEAASEHVMAVLRTFEGTLEVAGWDEAFLQSDTEPPEALARGVQRAVIEGTGLWCSVGIGQNKLQAKIASGLAKPAGVFRLSHDNWHDVMDDRATSALSGIGEKRARALARRGIATVGALAVAGEADLADEFGPNLGPWLRTIARGEDDSPVLAEAPPARSVGHEVTFPRDVRDPVRVRDEVIRLAHAIVRELDRDGRQADRVVVKIRFAPFETHTHGFRVTPQSSAKDVLEQCALGAFDRFELDRPVRLVGVRADLAPIRGVVGNACAQDDVATADGGARREP